MMGKVTRVFGAACAATGTVAMSALTASAAAVYSIAEGFLTAGRLVKDAWKEEKQATYLLQSAQENAAGSDADIAASQTPEGAAIS